MSYAIRVDADTLLAVPPIHPGTSPAIRQRIFEYVLRRQFGLAALLASDSADRLDRIEGTRARLAHLMAETPHKNARGSRTAASAPM